MSSLYIPDFSEMLAVAQSRGADSEAPGLWNGLVGAWPLAEGGGVTAHDLSGYGNEGTLTNMDAATDHVVTEKGPALDFAGDDDYLRIIPNGLDNFTGFSVSALVHPHAVASGGIVERYDFGEGVDDGFLLRISAANTVSFSMHDNQVVNWASTTIVANVWQHIVGTWDGQTGRIYVDGQEKDSAAQAYTIGSIVNDLRIGARGDDAPATYFDGLIGPVSIWGRGVVLDEIQQLYAEPYAMYTLPRRVYKAAAVGGLSIPIAMHHYKQMMGA